MLFHASVRLGHANVPMSDVRQRLGDELPGKHLAGRFFVVRHAGETVCATANADTVDDLTVLVDALKVAGRSLADSGALDAPTAA